MNIRALTMAALVATSPLSPALADDVTDQINEALSAYSHKTCRRRSRVWTRHSI